MPVRPVPGVTVTVSQNGRLQLFSTHTEKRFECNGVGTAIWIALRQHDGKTGAAASMLANLWHTDPVNTLADIEMWVDELTDAGLLRNEL